MNYWLHLTWCGFAVPAEKQISILNTCYFRFSQDLKDDQIVSAHLGIYIRDWGSVPPASTRGGPATLILIYVIGRSSTGGTGRLEKTLYRRRRIHLTPVDMGKWHFFEVKSLVDSWTQDEDRNLGIQIYAQDLNGELLAVLPSSDERTNALASLHSLHCVLCSTMRVCITNAGKTIGKTDSRPRQTVSRETATRRNASLLII